VAVAPNDKSRLAGPSRPLGSPDIPQFHLPATGKGTYAPRLYGAATIHFRDKKRRVDEKHQVAFLVPLDVATRTVDWEGARAIDLRPDQLSKEPAAPGDYLPLPSGAMSVKSFTRWAKNFDRWLARTQRLDVPVKDDTPDAPSTIGPRRGGGISVELVAIVWELT
jgi:hypothetical protein